MIMLKISKYLELIAFSTSTVGFILAIVYRQLVYGLTPFSIALLINSWNRYKFENIVSQEIAKLNSLSNSQLNYSSNKKENDNPKQYALFWDYENVRFSSKKNFLKVKKKFSNKVIDKNFNVYLNNNVISNEFIDEFKALGFTVVNTDIGKNQLDIKLAIDCMKLALEKPEISGFIFISHDRDHLILVKELNKLGKEILFSGFSRDISTKLSRFPFVKFEDFIDQKNVKISYMEAINCLVDTVKLNQISGKQTSMSSLDVQMRNNPNHKYNGIDSLDLDKQFRKFNDFIASAEEDGYVTLELINNNMLVRLSSEN